MAEAADARRRDGHHPTRYTLCGEALAEARVAQDLARLATGIDSELGDQLRGLLLVGPFARAEGGICERDAEPQAAPPGYQLLALVRRPERFEAQLRAMSAAYRELLRSGVDIRGFATQELARVEATRFWFSAGRGCVLTLTGDPAFALAIPRREPRELRWQESALALAEGLSGLALANLERGDEPKALLHATQRAVLGCVDGLLLRRGQYADTLAARAEALTASHASASLRAAYRDAIAWSSRPDRFWPEHGDFEGWRAATRRALAHGLLAADAERLQGSRDLLGYARLPEPLFTDPSAQPGAAQRVLRALARSAQRAGGLAPTERLLRASAVLALGSHAPDHGKCARQLLGLPDSASDADVATALRRLSRDTLRASRFEHPFADTELQLGP